MEKAQRGQADYGSLPEAGQKLGGGGKVEEVVLEDHGEGGRIAGLDKVVIDGGNLRSRHVSLAPASAEAMLQRLEPAVRKSAPVPTSGLRQQVQMCRQGGQYDTLNARAPLQQGYVEAGSIVGDQKARLAYLVRKGGKSARFLGGVAGKQLAATDRPLRADSQEPDQKQGRTMKAERLQIEEKDLLGTKFR